MLIARHAPALVAGIRVLESTDVAPMPAFVAAPALPADAAARLRAGFAAAASRPWFPSLARELRLAGFAPVARETYAPALAWAREAEAAGYPVPA
jgi:ABC-type phosphate/phosphonate transport system substrate-binding protein